LLVSQVRPAKNAATIEIKVTKVPIAAIAEKRVQKDLTVAIPSLIAAKKPIPAPSDDPTTRTKIKTKKLSY